VSNLLPVTMQPHGFGPEAAHDRAARFGDSSMHTGKAYAFSSRQQRQSNFELFQTHSPLSSRYNSGKYEFNFSRIHSPTVHQVAIFAKLLERFVVHVGVVTRKHCKCLLQCISQEELCVLRLRAVQRLPDSCTPT